MIRISGLRQIARLKARSRPSGIPPVINITLSASNVAENAAIGSTIGTFSVANPEAYTGLAFALTDDAGGRFALSGANLIVGLNGTFNYETTTSYSVTVEATADNTGAVSESFTINVTNVNEAPSDISLSANTVAEDATPAMVIGQFSGSDPENDTLSFAMVDGAGHFGVTGNNLVVTTGGFDFETTQSYSITVRATDTGTPSLTFDKQFTVNVSGVNEQPTDIALSASTVTENVAVGTVVGTFSATDPDTGDTITFTLTDTADGLFGMSGSDLVTAAAIDYESGASHNITVRATDIGGLYREETFAITVNDVADTTPVISHTDSGYAGSTYTTTVGGGQWQSNGAAIPGETGTTFAMTAAYEGTGITYKSGSLTSNEIKYWTPATLSANIVSWWDAYDTPRITRSGSNVTQVTSKVGSINLTASANWPTYSATGRNSKPAFLASTTSQRFAFSTLTGLPTGTASSSVIALAYNNQVSGSFRAIVSWGSGSTGGNQARFHGYNNGAYGVTTTGSSTFDTAPATGPWNGTDRIFYGGITSSVITTWVDGQHTFEKTGLTVNTATVNNGAVFAGTPVGGTAWTGSFQEILIFNATLSTTNRQKIEGYIASKWGLRSSLAAGHPYKNANPT